MINARTILLVALAGFAVLAPSAVGAAGKEASGAKRVKSALAPAPVAVQAKVQPPARAQVSKEEAAKVKAAAGAAGSSAGAGAGAGSSTVLAGPANAPDRSQVSARAISLPQGAGKVDGLGESFSVQASTGVATFTVPIPVPPARGAVDPAFALNYKTSAGAGIAGVGWSLGAPFIARETSKGVPVYDDRGVFHAGQDHFVFGGGQLLVPICVVSAGSCAGALSGERFASWADGWQYFRAQVEGGFQRFFWSPGGRTWRVQEQSGNTWELGEPLEDVAGGADDSALEADPLHPTHIYRWNVARQYDPEGNTQAAARPSPRNVVRYRYIHDGGTAYLSDVYYTNPASGPDTGDLASYATHVHFAYEPRRDQTTSYRAGFPMRTAFRLSRVDVTAKPFYDGAAESAQRVVLRRVHLSYNADYYASYLERVQTEGRDAASTTEGADGLLPLGTTGPRLPAMRLTYSHVGTTPEYDGFERFDAVERPVLGAPSIPFSDSNVVFMDVDQDGLPDLLHADPSAYRASGLPAFGWFRNGAQNVAGRFAAGVGLGLGLIGADIASDIRFTAPNVGVLDLDGNGVPDFFHLPPFANKARVYSFGKTGPFGVGNLQLGGREVKFPQNQAARLQLFQDSSQIRVGDINGDGLVDFVRLSGTTLEVYEALGRQPGGDGLFGSARRTGAHTAQLSEAPHAHCVPTLAPGIPAKFDDPAFRFTDLNGDGLLDLAYVQTGSALKYWPGRGTGYFGTGDEPLAAGGAPVAFCPSDRWLIMPIANAPLPTFAAQEEMRLEDLNGDGLDDLVHLGPNRIRVWLNKGGDSLATARDITGVNLQRGGGLVPVRVFDLDGSGTRDLVYGDSVSGLVYRDLSGGKRPGLLTELATGLGKTTALTYSTSAYERMAADAAGLPWQSTMPLVTHVVKSTTVRDNLGLIGRPDGRYVTEYSYRDPVYDARRRDFQGFRIVESRNVGDAYTQSSILREQFMLPKCEALEVETDLAAANPCSTQGLYREDPLEALSGLPIESHVVGADGTPFSSTLKTFQLQTLYTGLDGRRVRHAGGVGYYAFTYNSAPGGDRTLNTISVQSVFTAAPAAGITLAATTLTQPRPFVTLQTYGVDAAFGSNTLDGFGQSSSEFLNSPGDPSIQRVHFTSALAADAGGWMFRLTSTGTTGSPTYEERNHVEYTYDALGHRTQTSALLSGSLALDRFHASGGAIAPAPVAASVDGMILMASSVYDGAGNVVSETGPNGRCHGMAYAPDFGDLVTSETVYAGAAVGGAGAGSCGATALTTTAKYDRGYGKVTESFDLHGEHGYALYDGFGRVSNTYAPQPGDPTLLGPYQYTGTSYDLPEDDRVRPYTKVFSYTSDGPSEQYYNFREAYAYADGLGRNLVTVEESDIYSGDAAGFVASGQKVYDAKSNVVQVYEPYFTSSGDGFDFTVAPASASITMRYDALGRMTDRWAQDGARVLHHDYRGFSDDLWDAADLTPGHAQAGTYLTTQVDGHGRPKAVTEREAIGGTIVARTTENEFLSTGEVDLIRRTTESGTVVRWMRYDSLGRMVANVEPHTTSVFSAVKTSSLSSVRTLRYAWDDAGDLVGTSDARGCGVNFFHDTAGRVLAEDFSPCAADHAAYSTPNVLTGDGTEAFTRYDTEDPSAITATTDGFERRPGFYLGRAASVSDRGKKSLIAYDGRGRVVSTAVQLAHPGDATPALSTRYAARFYVQNHRYDDADRLVASTTGARSATLLGTDGLSEVSVAYSGRGLLSGIGGSYGTLMNSVVHRADGLMESMAYGDLAGTQTTHTYDLRKRLVNALTQRQAPTLWGTGNATYTAPVSNVSAQLTLAQTHVTYDVLDNPVLIEDLRAEAEWPAGHKPQSRAMTYDGLNRVTGVTYSYAGAPPAGDTWTSSHKSEHDGYRGGNTLGQRGIPKPENNFPKRVQSETYAYDALGNRTQTDDDAHGFWDRSLGTESHNGAPGSGSKPYQLASAQQSAAGGSFNGSLTASYDAMGNTTSLSVFRPTVTGALCMPTSASCSQRFAYSWDEVNRLVRARRWDGTPAALGAASAALPAAVPNADLQYAYDASDARVRTSYASEPVGQRHTLQVFPSLELRKTSYVGAGASAEYTLNDQVETVYAVAPGTGLRLAKIVSRSAMSTGYGAGQGGALPNADGPVTPSGPVVLLHVQDALGSVSAVIEKSSGELVEARGYHPYGNEEHDLRSARWNYLREDIGFTGKEVDVEVGIIQFGKRFLVPSTGRWLNPDPLALHVPGSGDLNLYAYVHGRVFTSIDPNGLEEPRSGISAFFRGVADEVKDAVVKADGALQHIGGAAGDFAYGAINHDNSATIRGGEALLPTLRSFTPVGMATGTVDMVKALPGHIKDAATNTNATITNLRAGDAYAAGHTATKAATHVAVATMTAQTVIGAGQVATQGARTLARSVARTEATAAAAAAEEAGAAAANGCKGGGCGVEASCFVAGTSVTVASSYAASGAGVPGGTVPIEQVALGSRVISSEESTAFQKPLDLSEPQRIVLVGASEGSERTTWTIELLRGKVWVESEGLRAGGWTRFELPDAGFSGYAYVKSVTPARALLEANAQEPGRLVTMTMNHLSNAVASLELASEVPAESAVLAPRTEVLTGTLLHPFFSLERKTWVHMGDLRVGERIQSESGPLVVRSLTQADSAQVYNFEVDGAHTYLVGNARVWSHNAGDCGVGGVDKTFQTYTKTNPSTGEVYTGRTSGTGTPAQNIAVRDRGHHMNEKGFGKAQLDKTSMSKDAIRGREQHMIEQNGGAQSQGGTSGNVVNGVSPANPKAGQYSSAASNEFGP
jgi:RHS repeat-associated protein